VNKKCSNRNTNLFEHKQYMNLVSNTRQVQPWV